MTGTRRERTGAAPAREPTDDQPGVAGEQRVGRQPEPFEHARPKALEQYVGRLQPGLQGCQAIGRFQVERQSCLAEVKHVVFGCHRHAQARIVGWRYPDDLGAQAAQQLAGEGYRADRVQFDDRETREGAFGRVGIHGELWQGPSVTEPAV